MATHIIVLAVCLLGGFASVALASGNGSCHVAPPFASMVSDGHGLFRAVCAPPYVAGLTAEGGVIDSSPAVCDTDRGVWVVQSPCQLNGCADVRCSCVDQDFGGGPFAGAGCVRCLFPPCGPPELLGTLPVFLPNTTTIQISRWEVDSDFVGLRAYPLLRQMAITAANIRHLITFPSISLPNLAELNLARNNITVIAPTFFAQAAFAGLVYLGLQDNWLTFLPSGVFAPLSKLSYLVLGSYSQPQLQLPFALLAPVSSLQLLTLFNVNPANMTDWMSLAALPKLTTLKIFASNMSTMALTWLTSPALTELTLSGCDLTRIPDVTGLSALNSLNLDNNSIVVIPEATLAMLQTLFALSMSGNPSNCSKSPRFPLISCTCAALKQIWLPSAGSPSTFCEPACPAAMEGVSLLSNCSRPHNLPLSTCTQTCAANTHVPALGEQSPIETTCTDTGNVSAVWKTQGGDIVDPRRQCAAIACVYCSCDAAAKSFFCTGKFLSVDLLQGVPEWVSTVELTNMQLERIPLFNTPVSSMDLTYNAITSVVASDFHGTMGKHLRMLDLSNNYIAELLPGTFVNVPNLEWLAMSGNDFTVVPLGTFANVTALKSLILQFRSRRGLNLRYGQLTAFPELLALHQLEYLDIGSQRRLSSFFEELPPTAFAMHKNLSTVFLSGLFFPNNLPASVLHIPSTRVLSCIACGLSRLEPWPSTYGRAITNLVLTSNDFEVVAPGVFGAMPKLRVLDMFSESVTSVNCTLMANGNVLCRNCPFANASDYCAPSCATANMTQLTCSPAPVYGANCSALCESTRIITLASCLLNGSWAQMPGCAGPRSELNSSTLPPATNLISTAAPAQLLLSSSVNVSLVVAVVMSLVAIASLLALFALVIVCRRKERLQQMSSVMELENLVVEKVDKTFALAFAEMFSAEQIAIARQEFKSLEIPRKTVKFQRLIGQGQSGAVYLGIAQHRAARVSRDLAVAVKVSLHDNANASSRPTVYSTDTEETLQLEARLLHQLQHAHIVQVLATVTQSFPTWVCLEYMANGDLKTYLRACRPSLRVKKQVVSAHDMEHVLWQVSCALSFLEGKRVIHRDIAARNVLVGQSLDLVKLGDLGATRVLDERSYYRKRSQAHIPLKWMAPEAIREARYTVKSDVWAFGVLAYEVTSFAMTPYGALGGEELLSELEKGFRLPQPAGCPSTIYQLMLQCWQWAAADRPAFVEVCRALKISSDASASNGGGADVASTQFDADQVAVQDPLENLSAGAEC